MARIVLFLVLFHVASSMLTNHALPRSFQIKDIGKDEAARQIAIKMRASPDAVNVQANGCHQLMGVLDRNSVEPDQYLGAFQAAADAIASGRKAALTCIPWLGGLAVFNRPMTFLLNNTNAMKNTIAFLRDHVNDAAAGQISNNIASMSTQQEIVPYVVQLGGIDVLFDYLERWQADPHATLSAWAGLSDPSHGAAGARAIVDHGGHHEGIKLVMQKIHSYPAHFGKSLDTLSVRYESLQIVNGILSHDYTNEYGKAFLEAGLLQEVVKTMKVEPDMRAANSVSCEILGKLFDKGLAQTCMPALQESGVIELINTALITFHDDFPMPWNGGTVGQYYKVIPECSNVLVKILETSPESKQQMLDLGVPKTLQDVRLGLKDSVLSLQHKLD